MIPQVRSGHPCTTHSDEPASLQKCCRQHPGQCADIACVGERAALEDAITAAAQDAFEECCVEVTDQGMSVCPETSFSDRHRFLLSYFGTWVVCLSCLVLAKARKQCANSRIWRDWVRRDDRAPRDTAEPDSGRISVACQTVDAYPVAEDDVEEGIPVIPVQEGAR